MSAMRVTTSPVEDEMPTQVQFFCVNPRKVASKAREITKFWPLGSEPQVAVQSRSHFYADPKNEQDSVQYNTSFQTNGQQYHVSLSPTSKLRAVPDVDEQVITIQNPAIRYWGKKLVSQGTQYQEGIGRKPDKTFADNVYSSVSAVVSNNQVTVPLE